jgi:hypothetical protein
VGVYRLTETSGVAGQRIGVGSAGGAVGGGWEGGWRKNSIGGKSILNENKI